MNYELTKEQVHRLALEKLEYEIVALWRGKLPLDEDLNALPSLDHNLVAQLEALLVTDEQKEGYMLILHTKIKQKWVGHLLVDFQVKTASPLDCARAVLKVLEEE